MAATALLTHPLAPGDARATGVLVTAAGPRMRDVLHDLALPTFRRYAERWDYTVHAVDLTHDGAGADPAARRAKWAKLALLRQALRTHATVVWVDADVLLMSDDEDIADHLAPGDFQALAFEQVPAEHRINPNTGVWVMRAVPQSFAFLDAVEAVGPQPGPWADQGAVLAALGWNRGDESYRWARPGLGSPFLGGTAVLPPGWNQPFTGLRGEAEIYNGDALSYVDRPLVARPHALHFMGMTPEARYRTMSAVAGSVSVPAARAGRETVDMAVSW